MSERNPWKLGWLILLLVLLAASLVLSPLVDPSDSTIHLGKVISQPDSVDSTIFYRIRLPRALFGALVGLGLALSGAVFQALLRNDLATPYTLGLSGGSTLGALAVLHFAGGAISATWGVPFGAFLGAMAVVVFVGLLARWLRGGTSTNTILLAGVTLNLFFSSFILLLQYLSDPYELFSMIRWMMGGLNVTDIRLPLALTIPVLACALFLCARARMLDLLSLGDEAAHHLGVSVDRTRALFLVVSGLLTALLVAYSGPIGFVGLIVPHLIRRLFGPGHRFLLPASALFGASFLVWCDTVARTAYAGHEIPVGIVTAFIGAPFFLYVLIRSARKWEA
jgi:iron complex transport system permease protein